MNRNTLMLAVLALVVVGLATPFQLLEVPLAPVAALVFGAIAGWWVARSHMQGAEGGATRAGAIVGVGALVGSVIGLAVLGLWIGNIPEVQAFVQSSEPHPEARIPQDWIPTLAAFGGVIGGLLFGLIDLVLSAVAAWAAGALYNRSHHTGV